MIPAGKIVIKKKEQELIKQVYQPNGITTSSNADVQTLDKSKIVSAGQAMNEKTKAFSKLQSENDSEEQIESENGNDSEEYVEDSEEFDFEDN